MKLAMFTPGLQQSAIGHVAKLVTGELLRQGHEVTVVRSEDEAELGRAPHAFGTEVIAWNDRARVLRAIDTSDAIVYHVGNHFGYHRGCLEWLAEYPGIVCVHDYFLGHLFTVWAQHRRAEAVRLLRHWYGDTAAATYFTYNSSDEFIEGTRSSAPMTEWVCSQASGVVTHSSWDAERILQACGGPVRVVPLAYSAPGVSAPAVSPPPDGASFSVLTVGHANPNKRAESVIAAIAGSEVLRRHAVYRLVGAIEAGRARQLQALAETAGVRLVVSGECSPVDLAEALAAADVVCCLRWPTLEAASASTIEALLSAKAVVVEDVGFYAELPDDCVAKVRPDHEVEDLRAALERLYLDPAERATLGQRARDWAGRTFSPANYAEQLVAMVPSCQRFMPALGVLRATAEQFGRWGASGLVRLPQTLNPLGIFAAAPAPRRQPAQPSPPER